MGLHVPAPGYHHKPLDFMVVIGSTDGRFTKVAPQIHCVHCIALP